MGARESYAQFQAFVHDLKIAAIARVLGERNIQDQGGEIAARILAAIEVDQLARDAWRNGKRNLTELGGAAFDQWWRGALAKRKP